MKFKLVEKKAVQPNIVTFIFEAPASFSWQAGQYNHYVLDHPNPDERKTERWFTISNAPYTNHPSITTRFADEHGSTFKKALHNLKPGDEIEVDGPEGEFVVADPAKNYIFIAGGIGITPFHAILTQLDHDHQPIKVQLLYANRDDNFPFDDEFQQIAQRNPNFKIHKFIDPKKIEESDIKQIAETVDNPLYYVSGPEPMVKAYADKLKSLGIAEDKIHLDDFPGYETI